MTYFNFTKAALTLFSFLTCEDDVVVVQQGGSRHLGGQIVIKLDLAMLKLDLAIPQRSAVE